MQFWDKPYFFRKLSKDTVRGASSVYRVDEHLGSPGFGEGYYALGLAYLKGGVWRIAMNWGRTPKHLRGKRLMGNHQYNYLPGGFKTREEAAQVLFGKCSTKRK